MTKVSIAIHRVKNIKISKTHILTDTGSYTNKITFTDNEGNSVSIDLFSYVKESLEFIQTKSKISLKELEEQYPLINYKIKNDSLNKNSALLLNDLTIASEINRAKKDNNQ